MPAETTLWTITGTLGAAFFTSVLAQYLFAPWLEARKEVHLEQYREQRDFSKRLGSVAISGLDPSFELLREVVRASLYPGFYDGARSKDLRLFAGCMTWARGQADGPMTDDFDSTVYDTFVRAAALADPMTPPWSRPWLRFRLKQRVKRSMKTAAHLK